EAAGLEGAPGFEDVETWLGGLRGGLWEWKDGEACQEDRSEGFHGTPRSYKSGRPRPPRGAIVYHVISRMLAMSRRMKPTGQGRRNGVIEAGLIGARSTCRGGRRDQQRESRREVDPENSS